MNFDPILYDAEGKEIEIPRCKNCDCSMSPVMGKDAMTWICLGECNGIKAAKFIYRPPK